MPESILLLDGDRHFRQLISRLLAAEGYRPVEADTATEATALVSEQTPYLSIADYRLLAGLDGLVWIEQMRRSEPRSRMVFLTGSLIDTKILTRLGDLLTGAMIIQKPINPSLLLKRVDALLPETDVAEEQWDLALEEEPERKKEHSGAEPPSAEDLFKDLDIAPAAPQAKESGSKKPKKARKQPDQAPESQGLESSNQREAEAKLSGEPKSPEVLENPVAEPGEPVSPEALLTRSTEPEEPASPEALQIPAAEPEEPVKVQAPAAEPESPAPAETVRIPVSEVEEPASPEALLTPAVEPEERASPEALQIPAAEPEEPASPEALQIPAAEPEEPASPQTHQTPELEEPKPEFKDEPPEAIRPSTRDLLRQLNFTHENPASEVSQRQKEQWNSVPEAEKQHNDESSETVPPAARELFKDLRKAANAPQAKDLSDSMLSPNLEPNISQSAQDKLQAHLRSKPVDVLARLSALANNQTTLHDSTGAHDSESFDAALRAFDPGSNGEQPSAPNGDSTPDTSALPEPEVKRTQGDEPTEPESNSNDVDAPPLESAAPETEQPILREHPSTDGTPVTEPPSIATDERMQWVLDRIETGEQQPEPTAPVEQEAMQQILDRIMDEEPASEPARSPVEEPLPQVLNRIVDSNVPSETESLPEEDRIQRILDRIVDDVAPMDATSSLPSIEAQYGTSFDNELSATEPASYHDFEQPTPKFSDPIGFEHSQPEYAAYSSTEELLRRLMEPGGSEQPAPESLSSPEEAIDQVTESRTQEEQPEHLILNSADEHSTSSETAWHLLEDKAAIEPAPMSKKESDYLSQLAASLADISPNRVADVPSAAQAPEPSFPPSGDESGAAFSEPVRSEQAAAEPDFNQTEIADSREVEHESDSVHDEDHLHKLVTDSMSSSEPITGSSSDQSLLQQIDALLPDHPDLYPHDDEFNFTEMPVHEPASKGEDALDAPHLLGHIDDLLSEDTMPPSAFAGPIAITNPEMLKKYKNILPDKPVPYTDPLLSVNAEAVTESEPVLNVSIKRYSPEPVQNGIAEPPAKFIPELDDITAYAPEKSVESAPSSSIGTEPSAAVNADLTSNATPETHDVGHHILAVNVEETPEVRKQPEAEPTIEATAEARVNSEKPPVKSDAKPEADKRSTQEPAANQDPSAAPSEPAIGKATSYWLGPTARLKRNVPAVSLINDLEKSLPAVSLIHDLEQTLSATAKELAREVAPELPSEKSVESGLDPQPSIDAPQQPPSDVPPQLPPDVSLEPASDASLELASDVTLEPASDVSLELASAVSLEPASDASLELASAVSLEPASDASLELASAAPPQPPFDIPPELLLDTASSSATEPDGKPTVRDAPSEVEQKIVAWEAMPKYEEFEFEPDFIQNIAQIVTTEPKQEEAVPPAPQAEPPAPTQPPLPQQVPSRKIRPAALDLLAQLDARTPSTPKETPVEQPVQAEEPKQEKQLAASVDVDKKDDDNGTSPADSHEYIAPPEITAQLKQARLQYLLGTVGELNKFFVTSLNDAIPEAVIVQAALDLSHRIRGLASTHGLKEISRMAGEIEDLILAAGPDAPRHWKSKDDDIHLLLNDLLRALLDSVWENDAKR